VGFLFVGRDTVMLNDLTMNSEENWFILRDFDDCWSPFLGGQGPAPSYTMSLSEERRTEFRERISASLPSDAEGGISLSARAWAIRSVR
jgi:hypothetical protein